MSDPNLPIEQLLELLITLKKTTPAAARTILNSQPAIAYALITLMVSMNAVNIEVFHKALAESAAQAAPPLPVATPAPAPNPMPAIPPHMQNLPPASSYRHTPTPPHHTPTPPYGVPTPPPTAGYPQSSGYQGYPGYPPPPAHAPAGYPPMSAYGAPNVPPVTGGTPLPPALPDALANIPEEQKALIYRVLSMTPEQINVLPPHERNTYLQIRASLGVPT